MLIKLVPEPPNPSVLFAITFANAPFAYSPDKAHDPAIPEDALPETSLLMSAGWASQLSSLTIDDLDPPTALHALDRAAGIPTLVQEVMLDVPSSTIRCSFIDGTVEEWVLPSDVQTPVPADKRPVALSGPTAMQRYMDMLGSVIRDVNQSAIEDERDRQKEAYSLQQQQQEQQGSQSSDSSRPSSPRPTFKTHKKQRSFFMNFVASIVNLTPSAIHLYPRPPLPPSPKRSPSPVLIPISPPPSPTRLCSPFPPLWSPPNTPMRQTLRSVGLPANTGRALRWRARSTLVDAFRRFVLPEIVARASYGTYRNYHAINIGICGTDGTGKVGAGYYVWAIESMLRQASQRMDELANMATATVSEKDKDRKTKTRIFPRFSVPRRKSVQVQQSVNRTPSVGHYRRSAETRAERERERQDAEYFATTTQSIQLPHLFSDEEDSVEGGQGAPWQRKVSDTALNEAEDTETVDTDTDGSSVHTPSSEHESFTFPPSSNKLVRRSKLPLLVPPRHTRSVSQIVLPTSIQAKGTLITDCPPPGSLPPTEMAEYKSLSRLTGKLQHLLFSARTRASQAENEVKQRDAILEVRSRRRAWLNRALRPIAAESSKPGYHAKTYGYIATCTMSTPSSSSPLARWTWTSDDWEYVPETLVGDDEDDIILQERARFAAYDESEQLAFGSQLRRMNSGRDVITRGEAMLFPVIEEEEPGDSKPEHINQETLIGMGIGDDDDLRQLELGLAGFNMDVEAGEMAWIDNDHLPCAEDGVNPSTVDGPGIRVALEPERPRVRMRTSSLSFGRAQIQQSLNSSIDQKATPGDSPSPPGLTVSSLLCHPLTTNSPSRGDHGLTQAVLMTPPVEKAETPMICASFAGEIRDSDEFTLSMDLPPPMKGRTHISSFGSVPAAQSLTIFSPSPQCGRQVQLTTVPDAR